MARTRPKRFTLAWFESLSKRDFDNGATLDEIAEVYKQRDTLLAACKAVLANETCADAFRAAMNMDEKFADDCPEYRLDCERDRDVFNQLTAAIAKAEGE